MTTPRYTVVPRKYWPTPLTFTRNVEIADQHRSSRGLSVYEVCDALRGAEPCVPYQGEDDGSVIFPVTVEGRRLAQKLCEQLNEIAAQTPSLSGVATKPMRFTGGR
jgi:hypothetical protein